MKTKQLILLQDKYTKNNNRKISIIKYRSNLQGNYEKLQIRNNL